MAAMLTTVDNPYDPRTDWDHWRAWDLEHGYNTCEYLARIVLLVDDFPQDFIDRWTEEAIDEIIAAHDGGMYKKLVIED